MAKRILIYTNHYFPEQFKIHINDKIAKKQFGNAVPTNVIYYLAKEILVSK